MDIFVTNHDADFLIFAFRVVASSFSVGVFLATLVWSFGMVFEAFRASSSA